MYPYTPNLPVLPMSSLPYLQPNPSTGAEMSTLLKSYTGLPRLLFPSVEPPFSVSCFAFLYILSFYPSSLENS